MATEERAHSSGARRESPRFAAFFRVRARPATLSQRTQEAPMGTILRTATDRTSLRRTVRVPCEVVCAHSFQLLARETVDLSLTGMAVRALLPATHNTPAFVTFRIPESGL